uniref:(California timema) hypothetical protein n=1 Tax=Timema californicum TaxID=61474 RepID=A0A7R9P6Y1_TIMCA|nr:unnamed protein product [Timema californicum]
MWPLGSNEFDTLALRSPHTIMPPLDAGLVIWTVHSKTDLFSKGQCETDSYRFLAKNGGYVWVLTQATLLYGNRGQKPNSVVCVNFVTSFCNNPSFYPSLPFADLRSADISPSLSQTCSTFLTRPVATDSSRTPLLSPRYHSFLVTGVRPGGPRKSSPPPISSRRLTLNWRRSFPFYAYCDMKNDTTSPDG